MKNKIVTLRDGRTTCRILDKIMVSSNTYYLAIDFESGKIITIKPGDIFEVLEYVTEYSDNDKSSDRKLKSFTDNLISYGF